VNEPTRIDQVIPAIVEHDAVSNHTFEAQRLLQEMGFSSEIYARIIGPGCDGRVKPLDDLDGDRSRWLLYQSSIGSPAAEVFARHGAHKLLDYHNITPADLVERWLPPLGAETRLGRAQLERLASGVAFALADSGFNAAELDAVGYRHTRVVPVLVDTGNIEADPDDALMDRLARSKAAGGSDWLFVGQIAPHKAQHDIVKAFACYRRVFDGQARLHLVGREMGSTYRDAVRRFIADLGLSAAVTLTGSVSTSELAAYYASADVFVCCSDHEGFCAPIVEAMHRGVPVVVYAAAALPETVGAGGVLLSSKSPAVVASAVHHVVEDQTLHRALVDAGRLRASELTIASARDHFRAAIKDSIALA